MTVFQARHNGYNFDVLCILHLFLVSVHVESWSAIFMFIGCTFPLHNGTAALASITNSDTACVFEHAERDETEEERKRG